MPQLYLISCRELAVRKATQSTEHPDMSDVWDGIQRKARDHARSPMQWTNQAGGGFSVQKMGTSASPWMRMNDDFVDWNVSAQEDDPDSVLSFWRKMISFRRNYPSCVSPVFRLKGGQ